jgi:tight adherence protein C
MTTLYLGLGLIGLGILVVTLFVGLSTGEPRGVARSLALIEGTVTERSAVKTDLDAKDRLVIPLFDRTRALATRLSASGTAERLAKGLDRAGNPSPWTVERIFGVKGASLLLGVLLGFIYGGLSLRGLILAVALGAAFFFLPDLLLYNASLRRQEQLAKGLADALDLLTVCVEAGLGFDAAILQVARNVDGPISGEFARVLSEVQIGKSRDQAFAAMGERVTLPDVKNFVTAIIQADRLGIPIATVLREQTVAMRRVRRQRAEEKAQKVTVKILFPLLLCIFPAIFVVIIGPGAIRMATELFNGTL